MAIKKAAMRLRLIERVRRIRGTKAKPSNILMVVRVGLLRVGVIWGSCRLKVVFLGGLADD
jgi:hypothetical protein